MQTEYHINPDYKEIEQNIVNVQEFLEKNASHYTSIVTKSDRFFEMLKNNIKIDPATEEIMGYSLNENLINVFIGKRTVKKDIDNGVKTV